MLVRGKDRGYVQRLEVLCTRTPASSWQWLITCWMCGDFIGLCLAGQARVQHGLLARPWACIIFVHCCIVVGSCEGGCTTGR